jgi:hypothetical protein
MGMRDFLASANAFLLAGSIMRWRRGAASFLYPAEVFFKPNYLVRQLDTSSWKHVEGAVFPHSV